MNVLRSGLVTMLLLAAFSVQAACTWPAWEQFKKDYISQEGRVIDPSDARKITTSEGQSYGMFFALAANDRAAFDNLLDWTQNNLAQGSLKEHLPAWLWGKKENSKWEVLDSNSASDGDVWMAWALLEAGRLWKEQRYTDIGSALLKRIAREEVVTVPGWAPCCYRAKWDLQRITAGVLTPATCRRRWRSISPALARRGPRCAKPINVYCWKPPRKAFRQTGCAMRKTKAGS